MRPIAETLETETRADLVVFKLSGEIDSSNAEALEQAMLERLDPARSIVVDLGAVSYLDSAGVGMLFTIAGRMRARDERLRIVLPREAPIRRVLYLCALDSVADIDHPPGPRGRPA